MGFRSVGAALFPLFLLTAVSLAHAGVEEGKAVYQKRCIFCHGDEGAGDGPASERFSPKPRDFTMGLFKYRTTPSGMIPTDDDLFHVVSKGLPGTGMPAWQDILGEPERRDVVSYIKTFSQKFEKQKEPLSTVSVGTEIPSSPESIEKGRELFQKLECFKCHGNQGRGDGPSALTLADDKGDSIRPRNLTLNWHFRGGGEARDIYMRINTGLNGTPMPSFADSLDNEKSWHVANYVRSLSPKEKPAINPVMKSKRVEGEIPADPSDPFWMEGESGGGRLNGANWFPMVGQVIRETRHFTPTVRDVFVKSVFNDNEIGFWVAWNDPSQSKEGDPLPSAGEAELDLFGGDAAAEVAVASNDAFSIQFPTLPPEGFKKPYFLMGDSKLSVNLWTWEGDNLIEKNANGIDAVTMQPQERQILKGIGKYQDGLYTAVIKRSLTSDDPNDTVFHLGDFVPIAFQARDGHNEETGSKMAISHWYFLLLEPETPKEAYIYPPVVFMVVLGIELLIRRRLRKKGV